MTGLQTTSMGQQNKREPVTPPPEYTPTAADNIIITQQVLEKGVRGITDPVSAAIPLLEAHHAATAKPPSAAAAAAAATCPPLDHGAELPPEYTQVLIEKTPTTKDGTLAEDEPVDDDDPWKTSVLADSGPSWSELDGCGRTRLVFTGLGKGIALLTLLYLFICSLDFLSSAFRLIGGKAAGEAFKSNTLLQNPIAGLMIGILATVLVQSSSTSTSIVVTMVASGIMDVKPAIPIVMGANIGTSVTNTIVSMAQSADRNQFRRAFAGATVHDMFNWAAVIILLPLEAATGYLYLATGAATAAFRSSAGANGANRDLLKTITKPFTKLIIQLDKKVLTAMATGDEELASHSLIKKWCKYNKSVELVNRTTTVNTTNLDVENITDLVNNTVKVPTEPCRFLFHSTGMSDTVVGMLLLALSLVMLCSCLIFMVKILHSMMRGKIAKVIKTTLNSDFPGCFSYFTGYVAMLVGAGMTILVQSSSVFTSAMTPLVGLGVIEIERMYPLTLGSNIGTTMTGVLAALAAPGDKLAAALQIAFAHLFFNISGILLFYPIPAMRFPIKLAKVMGNTTAMYRWFAIFYLVMMFFVLPAIVFSLSLLGLIPLLVVLGLTCLIVAIIVVINIMQNRHPKLLHPTLRTWNFLPECLHSLDPLDRVFQKLFSIFQRCCPCSCFQPTKPEGAPRVVLEVAVSEHLTLATETAAVEMTESRSPSQNNTPTSSQATSICSSRSTSYLILPKHSNL